MNRYSEQTKKTHTRHRNNGFGYLEEDGDGTTRSVIWGKFGFLGF